MLKDAPVMDEGMTTVFMLSSHTLKNKILERGRVYTLNRSLALSLIKEEVAYVRDSRQPNENKMIKIKYEG